MLMVSAAPVKVLRGLVLTKLSDYVRRDLTRQEVGVPTAIAVQVSCGHHAQV